MEWVHIPNSIWHLQRMAADPWKPRTLNPAKIKAHTVRSICTMHSSLYAIKVAYSVCILYNYTSVQCKITIYSVNQLALYSHPKMSALQNAFRAAITPHPPDPSPPHVSLAKAWIECTYAGITIYVASWAYPQSLLVSNRWLSFLQLWMYIVMMDNPFVFYKPFTRSQE